MNREALKESLRVHEGLSLIPYQCTEGFTTIGFGCNLDKGISIQQAYALLECDIDTAIAELDRAFKGWRDHDSVRQNVLIELLYNMGAFRLSGFKRMWAALDEKDYAKAAAELLDSKWRRQVGQRAYTLAEAMERG